MDQLKEKIDRLETMLMDIKDEFNARRSESKTRKTTLSDKEAQLSDVVLKKIQNILEDFDFAKVHRIMELLEWKWAMTLHGVPTIDELKAEARRLLVDAACERTHVATGGFRAVYDEAGQGDPDPYIGLEFILEECEGFIEDDDGDTEDED